MLCVGACSSQPSADSGPAAAGAMGSAIGCRPSNGDVYAADLEKLGAAGHFDFTLVSSSPAPPALGDNQFLVRVSRADGGPVDGQLSVALDMPEHGHPSPKQPQISFDAEGNVFSLDPMRLFMVGLWRITFSFEGPVDGATLSDSATFEFCID